IRTLDIGGDKDIPYMDFEKEENPFLGFRAVRYCLANPDMYKTQLRAITRASAFGKAKIISCTSKNGKNNITGATLSGTCTGF
ncbi:MAG: hypothetical protein IKI37_04215, partial [Oscillospiraceae bacterium]|nr:hypothetical protein [Oscillospiraceae bacterium]